MVGIRSKDLQRLRKDIAYFIPWGNVFMPINRFYFGDEVLAFILEHISPGSTVVELGGGQSTLELVKHYNVYTVEDNEEYLNQVSEAHYIHAPLTAYYDKKLTHDGWWYDRPTLKQNLPLEYDVLIIDGPEVKGSLLGRYGAARYYASLFQRDVPVLIDDLQVPQIYLTALLIARFKEVKHIDINITEDHRVFGWIV